ncbi:MAG: magnesium and cobalt exporter, family [Abditibacteriota bacterium]|nr:magnesium and cobalt exporter, family [Abditibacteriota bacterium]
MSDFTLCYIALLVCLFLVALFAASEAGLAATSRVRLRQLLRARADSDDHATHSHASHSHASHSHASYSHASTPAEQLSRDEQRFIATVTIAANIPLVVASALSVWLAFESFGASWEAAGVCVAMVLASIPVFQIAPRLLAAQPGALKQWWWVRPAQFVVAVLRPLVSFLLALGGAILRPLGLLPPPAATADNEGGLENADEIRDLVETAQASGVLEEGHELIESIFTFGDTRVHEVMIPRPDIVALPLETPFDRVLDVLQESGLSRIPIYEESIDRIIGVLHAKDILRRWSEHNQSVPHDERMPALPLDTLLRPPLFLPESNKIDVSLNKMRARRSHLAIVIDEYGGTAGLLTIEDILEELVGEIADEHDVKVEEALVVLDENTALVDALLHLEDLREDWNLALPAGEFDTVGGFVIEQLGRAPVSGDRIETSGATLTVHTVRARRPKKILITRKFKEEEKGRHEKERHADEEPA